MNCPNDPKTCVRIDKLCNGKNDCGDGNEATDEDPYICYLHHRDVKASCQSDQIECPAGKNFYIPDKVIAKL